MPALTPALESTRGAGRKGLSRITLTRTNDQIMIGDINMPRTACFILHE